MPLPGDVSTFTLTFGPYTDAAGYTQLAGITGTLTPVDATGKPITVLHAGDGSVIVPAAIPVTVENNGTATVIGLAHTDDTHLTPQNFLYQMTWNVPSYRLTLVNKTFAVPTASGATVDYDLLQPDGGSTPLVYVPLVVTSVNGHTGAVTLVKSDIGLGSVDNTADTAKPVSTAQQTALNAKGNLAGPNSWTGTQDFTGATVTGVGGVGGGLPANVVTKATAYTAAAGDLVQADASSAGFTVTLPAAPTTGALVTVKKIDGTANVVTVAPAAGGNIDGDATATTSTSWAAATLEHIGSNAWRVVAASIAGTQGPQGTQGPAGATGPAGPTGPTGPSGLATTIVNRSTAYTASVDDFVQCDTSTAGFTVTLPSAPSVGAPVTVIKTSSDGNTLTVAPAGAGSINGDTTATAVAQWAKATFEHVGSDVWRIV